MIDDNSFSYTQQICIPEKLDDLQISIGAYRIYAHLANPVNKQHKTAQLISNHCKMHITWTRRSLSELVQLNLIQKYHIQELEALRLIKSKTPQFVECGLECEWCNSTSFLLHEHHYPIKRSLGGSQTVQICSNCHSEFHYLTEAIFYALVPEKSAEPSSASINRGVDRSIKQGSADFLRVRPRDKVSDNFGNQIQEISSMGGELNV
ncbi:MAG: hypothetical protein KME30_32755 [Iphinoe sp. HA4291-MV1]|jgi:hypothetical protein|nr:hypothetical protein [Iphinoe sp. HA4291-MV1]